MARNDPQVNLRMPAALKDAVDQLAASNKRSLTAEITAALEAATGIEADATATPRPMATIAPFGLRMQPDLKSRVEVAAASNNRSMNAEIVATLEEKYPPPASAPVMPAPDALVDDGRGGQVAAMFRYAAPDHPLGQIAGEQGFDLTEIGMIGDLPPDHALVADYENGMSAGMVLSAWHPEAPAGWTFGGKFDGEDGPFAVFLRKRTV